MGYLDGCGAVAAIAPQPSCLCRRGDVLIEELPFLVWPHPQPDIA